MEASEARMVQPHTRHINYRIGSKTYVESSSTENGITDSVQQHDSADSNGGMTVLREHLAVGMVATWCE